MPDTPSDRLAARADVATRMMLERLARGPIYKLSRFKKGGALCPAAVVWLETVAEPGCPENRMDGTRSRHVAGFVSGEYHQPERVYTSAGPGTREISREEYERQVREVALARETGRYDPRCHPFKPADLSQMEIPYVGRRRTVAARP